jgi:putative oxygen-independent coproporphyrinogen III oxidase
VHWPFCAAICPYCDFNVHLMRAHESDARIGDLGADMSVWQDAYTRELDHAFCVRPHGPVETVFFGGGTPSLMSPDLVGAILGAVDARWGLAAGAEVTLEANPMSAPEAHLQDLRAVGVTRLSLGVQAFDDKALKLLGRTHSADDAKTAFAAAQEIFPRASFDLIYARPHQSLAAWHDELSAALALGPQHMSLYQLTIEPGTPFAKLAAAGKLITPGEDDAAALYEVTQELTQAAGLAAYEISNHAAPGHACRHNVASWRGGDYIGLGPGAHGRVSTKQGRFATQAIKNPQDWLAAVAADATGGGHGWEVMQALDQEANSAEAVMLGLRLNDGVALADLAARGVVLDAARLAQARRDGLLSDDTTRLQASAQGRLLLDYLLGVLLA